MICKWIIFFNYMIIYYFTCSFWRIERLIFLRRNKIFIFGDCLLVFNCNRHSLPRMKFVFNLLPRGFQTFGPCEPLIPWGNFPRPPFKECSLGERTEFFFPKNLNVASWWNWIVLSCSHLKTAFFECMEDTSTGERFNPKEVDETHSLWNVLVRNSYDSILNSLLKTYKVDCYLGQKSYMARKAGSTPLWCAEKSVPASSKIGQK